jgi:hypothetical protein
MAGASSLEEIKALARTARRQAQRRRALKLGSLRARTAF